MMFQESMVVASLYTMDDQVVIQRWMRTASEYPFLNDLKDSNKVAEIALSSIQSKLPQGISIQEDGATVKGRKTWESSVSMRNDILTPSHLFEINWDDSQPGFSWPESYYVTLLPGYNLYVVTISQGSADVNSYFDIAIGCFRADWNKLIAENASLAVKAWWEFQHKELKKNSWKGLLKPGMIDEVSAFGLRDEVWNKVEASDFVNL